MRTRRILEKIKAKENKITKLMNIRMRTFMRSLLLPLDIYIDKVFSFFSIVAHTYLTVAVYSCQINDSLIGLPNQFIELNHQL